MSIHSRYRLCKISMDASMNTRGSIEARLDESEVAILSSHALTARASKNGTRENCSPRK